MSHQFTIKIDCSNDAFMGPRDTHPTYESAAPELARILREIADQIEGGVDYGWLQTIRDINGNDVGRYALKRIPTTERN